MAGNSVRAAIAVATSVILCAGCAAGPSTSASPAASYNITAVDGVTVQGEGQQRQGGSGAAISGVVSVDSSGCWNLQGKTGEAMDLVWPAGTRWVSDAHDAVRLSTGTEVRSGANLEGPGGIAEGEARSTLSVSPDVTCLGTDTVTFVALGNPTQITAS